MGRNVDSRRWFDTDPLTGAMEFFYYDSDTGGFTIETVMDVEPIIEANKDLFNGASTALYGKWGTGKHVARIPDVIRIQLAEKNILSIGGQILDEPKFRAWLNDRDNLLFRTFPGRV